MPGFDATGPNGMGPMTGGGRGYCAVPVPGGGPYGGGPNRQGGRGYGRGRGRAGGRGGYGWRHWYYATGMPGWMRAQQGAPAYGAGLPGGTVPAAVTAEEELAGLKGQAGFLKQQLEDIEGRIRALESKPGSEEA
jgi:hypothetical protein